MTDLNMEQINAAVWKSAQCFMQCLLCDELTQSRGVFVPDNPQEFYLGTPDKDKTRVVLHPICEKCFSVPDRDKLIRDKIAVSASKEKLQTLYVKDYLKGVR